MQHWKTQVSLKYQTKTNIVVQCFVGSERSQGPTSGHTALTRAHERSHGTHKGIGAVLSGHKGTRAVTRHSQEHTSAHTALTRAYERSRGTPWKSLLSSNGPVPPFARARV